MIPAQYYKGNGQWGRKLDDWVETQLNRAAQEQELQEEITGKITDTLTSGFNRDILRLNPKDVKFLKDCGIAPE